MGTKYSIGDYVLVSKQPTPGESVRFQPRNYDEIYQVVETHGRDGSDTKAYTLSDLQGSRELVFSQPVAADRLTSVEILPLAQPSADQRTRIQVDIDGTYCSGTIQAQSIDGKVHIKFDDFEEVEVYGLATWQYRWLA